MLTRFKNQYRPIMLIKGGHNIYCIVSEPCITRFLPAFTVKLDPGERLCATFSTHSPPGAWSIMMAAAAGSGEGGLVLLAQLVATFQLPFPVNV